MGALNSKFGKLALVIALFVMLGAVYVLIEMRGILWSRDGQSSRRDGGPYFMEATAAAYENSLPEDSITCSRNNAIVEAARKVGPSVVSISTIQVVRDPWFDLFYPFGRSMERKRSGLGSGVIIDKRGYILTNQHVIEGADEIKVTLADGSEFKARVIGADYESDLAVLKVDSESDLPVSELGDSNDLLVGEWAIAIGSPFGFLLRDSQPTVTVGVISALGRTLRGDGRILRDVIQTDADINPGNSGGVLANCYGQVIGINTAIYSTSGGSQGVGFAIPINTAKRVINELIQHGMVMEPWVGIEYQKLNKDIAEHLRSPVDKGLLVSHIIEGSPAQESGLMRGDIVVKINDRDIKTLDDAAAAVQQLQSGQAAIFRIVRGGQFQDISIKVRAIEMAEIAKTWFGLVVQVPTPESAREYKLSSYRKGVLITQVDRKSPADKADLKRGDLILRMAKDGSFRGSGGSENLEIKTIDDFRKFVSGIRSGQRIRIIFERKGELWRTYLTASKA